MSGFEAPVAAAGGRLLGGLAAPAGRALARKLTFRWAVSRRVRKRVHFGCRWRTYRSWLKTLTADELATPVEDIQGVLAKRLDAALCASSDEWAGATDHLSRALRLVDLTYPAIAAALGDGDRARLCESWAQNRSASVRSLLLELAGPGAALSAEDFGVVLRQQSAARRTVRLQAFSADEATFASYFERIKVLDVPAGGVIVLEGDFGSGKSEMAETWHRACIEDFVADRNTPFPVWLGAREALNPTLEDSIERQLGTAWRHGRGASIAIDGLDEIEPAAAQAVLDAARVLSRTFTHVRVLLTARPGILAPLPDEVRAAEILPEKDALQLVETRGGKPYETWFWTGDMRATVRRPFFALAAGIMLATGAAPRGEADLIRALVESALAKPTERSAVTSSETRAVLESLAVMLTRTGRDELSFSDRQIARSSRLTAGGPEGSVLFSLPIFQHWFAAQAILSGDVPAAEVVADGRSFGRWRWAAAVAAITQTDCAKVDELLGTWVSGNPGAAAWIIREAFSDHRDFRTEDDEDLDAATSGERLLRALRTWTEALGPLAPGLLPEPLVRGPVGLGVTVSGPRINIAFSASEPPDDYVTDVPPGVHPLASTASHDWLPWLSGAAQRGQAWPWTMVRDRIAQQTSRKLSEDPFLGDPGGVWVQERRFDLARHLLGRGRLFHGSLPADEVRARAVGAFDLVGWGRISFGRSAEYSGRELDELVLWLDTMAPTAVVSHLPEADVSYPASTWAWDFYSPQRLMEFEAEVYGRACDAYDEALAHSFARLGWSMPSSVLAPFGVILHLHLQRDDSARTDWGGVGVTLTRLPMALLSELAPTASEATWSSNRRAVIARTSPERTNEEKYFTGVLEHARRWLAMQGREPVGGLGWSSTIADQMSDARPSSTVAAHWLWDDLKSIGLGSGTFPQLR